jgi:hypothetical protein
MKTTEENFDRTLVMDIPPTYWDVDPTSGALSFPDPATVIGGYSGGWALVPGTPSCAYFTGTIDLSGYAMDDLTFYPYASYLQEGGFWLYTQGAGVYAYDILSSIPLDINEVILSMIGQATPGFIQLSFDTSLAVNQQNRDTVMHSQYRLMSRNIQFPGNYFLTPELDTIGSTLEPTAADRLYFMRIALVLQDDNPSPGDPSADPPIPPGNPFGVNLQVPGARIMVPGRMMKEPDLEYMMRLKRSYELANQV